MVSCCGSGSAFSWMFLITMALMFAGCFFMMMRMHRKGISMDCCARGKPGTDIDQNAPQA